MRQSDEQTVPGKREPKTPSGRYLRSLRFYTAFVLGLRIVTGLIGVQMSALLPLSELEQRVAAWPAQFSGLWLYRVLVMPWRRWDVVYYSAIAGEGYRLGNGTATFHPLHPWLAKPLIALSGGSVILSLLVVSTAALIGFLLVFERLALLDHEPLPTRRALILLLLVPPACILMAPYPESLFLLCAALTLLWARQERWLLAGLAGFAASLTRQQGLFLVLPILWEMAGRVGWRGLLRRPAWWLYLALPSLGILAFSVYRAVTLNDLHLDWSSPNSLIYGLLVSRESASVVPVQKFLLPPHALWLVFQAPLSLQTVIDLTLGALFVALLIAGWRQLRPSYRIYALAILLVSFAYYTGPIYPTMGLPRHLLLAFPVFLPLGRWARGWRWLALAVPFLLGYLFLTLLYFYEGWVP